LGEVAAKVACLCGTNKTLALTPTLSPGERENNAMSLVNSFVRLAIAAFLSCASTVVRNPTAVASYETGA
jgi:hypothetical protein